MHQTQWSFHDCVPGSVILVAASTRIGVHAHPLFLRMPCAYKRAYVDPQFFSSRREGAILASAAPRTCIRRTYRACSSRMAASLAAIHVGASARPPVDETSDHKLARLALNKICRYHTGAKVSSPSAASAHTPALQTPAGVTY